MKKIYYITLLFMLAASVSIFGVTKTLKSGGGTGINWNSNGSWTPSGIPTALDTVILSSSNSVIIDADAVCGTIIIEAGYSGSITFAGAFTLTVAGDWTNSGAPSFGSGVIMIPVIHLHVLILLMTKLKHTRIAPRPVAQHGCDSWLNLTYLLGRTLR